MLDLNGIVDCAAQRICIKQRLDTSIVRTTFTNKVLISKLPACPVCNGTNQLSLRTFRPRSKSEAIFLVGNRHIFGWPGIFCGITSRFGASHSQQWGLKASCATQKGAFVQAIEPFESFRYPAVRSMSISNRSCIDNEYKELLGRHPDGLMVCLRSDVLYRHILGLASFAACASLLHPSSPIRVHRLDLNWQRSKVVRQLIQSS